jgi:hypothetical protein
MLLAACLVVTVGGCGSRPLAQSFDGGSPSPEAGTKTPSLPPAPTSCPTTPPQLAAGCGWLGQVCPYTTTGCYKVFRCDESRWLEIVGCLKTTQGCPDQAPASRSACGSAVKGQNCYYATTGNACEASSIVQCDGALWRHVNGCATRDQGSIQETCPLQTTFDAEVVFEKPGKQVEYPAIAVAGTQVMVAVDVSAGKDNSRGIYLHRLDSSRPQDEQKLIQPPEAMLLGRDPSSNPSLAFARDRFLLAWVADDGWPQATDHQPGAFVRSIPLDGAPSKEILVDATASTISSLELFFAGGSLAYRHVSPHVAAKSAVSLVTLGSELAPVASSRELLADEGAPLEWFQAPIPLAFARVARRGAGYVVASPVAAAGDFVDDSGVQVCFHDPTASAAPCTRLTIGYPERMSVVAIGDGSVVLAYAGVGWTTNPPAVGPFRIKRVLGDGTTSDVSNIIVSDGTLASGPHLVPFDRGFAVAWTTVNEPGKKGGTLHVRRFQQTAGSFSHPSELKRTLPELSSSDRLAIAFAHTDRSLHLAWSVNGADGLSRVYRQRLICGSN